MGFWSIKSPLDSVGYGCFLLKVSMHLLQRRAVSIPKVDNLIECKKQLKSFLGDVLLLKFGAVVKSMFCVKLLNE